MADQDNLKRIRDYEQSNELNQSRINKDKEIMFLKEGK